MISASIDTSVVLSTCTRVAMLKDMVETLLSQMVALPFTTELVVVDDGSTDATAEFLSDLQQRSPVPVRVVMGQRRGIAAARNLALEHARGKWVASCDDDQLADTKWLEQLRATADACSASFIGGSMDLSVPAGHSVSDYGPRALRLLGHCAGTDDCARPMPKGTRPATNNVLMRASAVRGLGGFDQQFVQGGEDTDLFARAEEAGYTLWFEPRAKMQHVMTPARLSLHGLRWTAMRIGSGDARMEQHLHPVAGLAKKVALRSLATLLRDAPMLALAALTRNHRVRLEAWCSLWYTKGLLLTIPALIFPQGRGGLTYLQQMDFRRRNGERTA